MQLRMVRLSSLPDVAYLRVYHVAQGDSYVIDLGGAGVSPAGGARLRHEGTAAAGNVFTNALSSLSFAFSGRDQLDVEVTGNVVRDVVRRS